VTRCCATSLLNLVNPEPPLIAVFVSEALWAAAVVLAYIVAPFLLLRIHRTWGLVAAVLCLWLPLEFSLLQSLIGPVPAMMIGLITGVTVFLMHPVSRSGLHFALDRAMLRDAITNLLMFGALAIPLGLAIGFLRLQIPQFADFGTFPLIFLLNALPEEVLFRGVIQNVLSSRMNKVKALILASTIFGVAHLNNGSPVPNVRYFAMATLAGIFYGRAWMKRRNVVSSSLVHALVNTFWNVLFR
jgi:membrane protease YdiL (CAAX protease family)